MALESFRTVLQHDYCESSESILRFKTRILGDFGPSAKHWFFVSGVKVYLTYGSQNMNLTMPQNIYHDLCTLLFLIRQMREERFESFEKAKISWKEPVQYIFEESREIPSGGPVDE